MIITHASDRKITKISSSMGDALRGCLFFAAEGNTYNLTGECNFQYNLDVSEDKIIEARRFFFEHDFNDEIILDVLNALRNELNLDCDDETMSTIIDESSDIGDYVSSDDLAVSSWLVQQYQGILAHKLGYDCVESFDEQGTVYIAYCVNRKLEEIER